MTDARSLARFTLHRSTDPSNAAHTRLLIYSELKGKLRLYIRGGGGGGGRRVYKKSESERATDESRRARARTCDRMSPAGGVCARGNCTRTRTKSKYTVSLSRLALRQVAAGEQRKSYIGSGHGELAIQGRRRQRGYYENALYAARVLMRVCSKAALVCVSVE